MRHKKKTKIVERAANIDANREGETWRDFKIRRTKTKAERVTCLGFENENWKIEVELNVASASITWTLKNIPQINS